jgi:hypothetical protein
MSESGCPRCDNARAFYRDFMRVERDGGGMTWGGWYTCRMCWHKWDGVTASDDGVLPAGVVARERREGQDD